MGARFRLTWRGDQIRRKMIKASIVGVNQSMEFAVLHAKDKHEFTNRTSILERSFRIVEAARQISFRGVAGLWGSINVAYAIFIEFGTIRTRAFPTLRAICAWV